jgi:HPt (histidine-containing phosphotransfer) domain-containing protein
MPIEVVEAARKQDRTSPPEKSSQTDGDIPQDNAMSMLTDSFIRDARKAVTSLEELQANPEWEKDEAQLTRFTIIVHGMKSSLALVGEKALSEVAHELEDAGRDKQIDRIRESAPGFIGNLHGLLDRLEAERVKNDKNEDIENLSEVLIKIMQMCEDYDRKGIVGLITGIEKCTDETKAALDKISEHVLHTDFEEAKSIAASHLDFITKQDYSQ